jgi:hypothetical protein
LGDFVRGLCRPYLGNAHLKLPYALLDIRVLVDQFGKPPYEVPEGDEDRGVWGHWGHRRLCRLDQRIVIGQNSQYLPYQSSRFAPIRSTEYYSVILHSKAAKLPFAATTYSLRRLVSFETLPVMARTTKIITISLPPEMAAELERVRHEEHRTRSELIRETLRHYFRAGAEKQTDLNPQENRNAV